MSRRDTIIVAVLINIGLLLVLFSTAVGKKEQGQTEMAQAKTPKQEQHAQPVEDAIELAHQEKDDLEEVLSQFSQKLAGEKNPAPANAKQVPIPLVSDQQRVARVVVRKGDYLDKIAQEQGVDVDTIMSYNHLSDTHLDIGQILEIPISSPSKSEPKPAVAKAKEQPKKTKVVAKSSAASSEQEYYTIRRGDNPWLIALKYRIDLHDLLKLNGLDEKSARRLKPGDRIRIK